MTCHLVGRIPVAVCHASFLGSAVAPGALEEIEGVQISWLKGQVALWGSRALGPTEAMQGVEHRSPRLALEAEG